MSETDIRPFPMPSYRGLSRYNRIPNGVTGTGVVAAGSMRAFPFWVPNTCVLDRLGGEVTGAVVGSVIQLGIYPDSGFFSPLLNQLVADVGNIDGNNPTVQEIPTNVPLSGGRLYWAAGVPFGGAPTMRVIVSPAGYEQEFSWATAAPGAGSTIVGVMMNGVPGPAMPTSGTILGAGNTLALFGRFT